MRAMRGAFLVGGSNDGMGVILVRIGYSVDWYLSAYYLSLRI
jgi:hypothetical protein